MPFHSFSGYNDTEYEHVHIVMTTVNGAGKALGIINSYWRNIAYGQRKNTVFPRYATIMQLNTR